MEKHHYYSPGTHCFVVIQDTPSPVVSEDWCIDTDSSMYIRKSMLPSMEPCGSACFTMPQFWLQCEFRGRISAPCFPSLWYNSEHNPLCLSNSTVMLSSQKCLTRSQNKALQYVSLSRVHKISCMQLYRIVSSNRRFPDRNCSHAMILMEFKGLIPLLSL